MKDKDDMALDALFSSEPIADDGFSRRVMARVRRKIWLRRLALPVALMLGTLIALKPALEVLVSLYGVLTVLPQNALQFPVDAVPQFSTFIVVAAVVCAALFFAPLLED